MTRPRFGLVRTRLELVTQNPFAGDLVPVMSLRAAERQAFLSRSCPKNIGNLRELTWYCRQVPQLLGHQIYQYYYYLRFFLFSGLSNRTVILYPHTPSGKGSSVQIDRRSGNPHAKFLTFYYAIVLGSAGWAKVYCSRQTRFP
jgi:hypothetical protein